MSHSPTNRNELIDLVRQWHQDAIPWIPSGQGDHLSWGPPLNPDHAVLSCRALNRVIDHAVDDLTISVEAGMALDHLQDLLAAQNQWLPVDRPRDGLPGTVGGLVARGMAGGLRHRHLGIRDQIIGIGLLRTDGVEAHAGGRVVKNVAGYDLMRLLCGSWGSLALITELTLRVQPIKPDHRVLVVSGALLDQERFRADLMRSGLTPDRCDWQSRKDKSWYLRLRISSITDQAVNDQVLTLKGLANRHRLDVAEMTDIEPLDTGLPCENPTWLVRLAIPPSKLHHLIQSSALHSLQDWQWDLGAGSGCGDGWSASASEAHQLLALRHELTRLGGTLTILKQPAQAGLPAWLDAPSRALILAVKRQFDPRQQLCRGRLPGVNQPTL